MEKNLLKKKSLLGGLDEDPRLGRILNTKIK
jgi:hypothetical protein